MALMDEIFALAKRRGFVFPGSEIYGGIGGVYDLGPLGVELANNIKKSWWRNIVEERENVVGLDSSIIMHRAVWETSGHLQYFSDPLVECKHCHARFRADRFPTNPRDNLFVEKWVDSYRAYHGGKVGGDLGIAIKAETASHQEGITQCPNCFQFAGYTQPQMFNLMFKTHVGPVEEKSSETFLRPETAQGIFVNFANVVNTMRVKLPFGVAQIGKGFRNEITTGNFLFRVREFEMMELEYFTYPDKADADFEYWRDERLKWYWSLGFKKQNLRFREHQKEELAHYAVRSGDIEYNWPFFASQKKAGWGELEGIANRTDYDLKAHSLATGRELVYYDEKQKKKIVPYVIEPSAGVGRIMLAIFIDSYSTENGRTVLKLHPQLAPYKVAVFPLLANKPALVELARKVFVRLKEANLGPVVWDDRGNIGKRYYSQDEIGTPYCVTVDFQSLDDQTVTLRHRDTTQQERISIGELPLQLMKALKP